MRATACCCLVLLLVSEGLADSPDPPLENKRLPISTLIREDIFAGWRQGDMERFARGEQNIELLLEQRPHAKVELLAWKGGTKLFRAVMANEAGNQEEFQRLYKEALELFAEAKKAGVPQNFVVSAVTGGSYALFADRLPEELREAAWEECYDNYQVLWSQQGPVVEKLPHHIKGELLAGLIQSSQRTGRTEEFGRYLDKMLEVLPDTPYARIADRWKTDPQAAATGNISCKSCHAEGRLSARLVVIEDRDK